MYLVKTLAPNLTLLDSRFSVAVLAVATLKQAPTTSSYRPGLRYSFKKRVF